MPDIAARKALKSPIRIAAPKHNSKTNFGHVLTGGKQTGGNDICVATGMAVRCRRDARCRQRTGKRLSPAIWSSFNKERMSHLCDSTVAGPTARRYNVLASKCEYPPFRYPPFKCARKFCDVIFTLRRQKLIVQKIWCCNAIVLGQMAVAFHPRPQIPSNLGRNVTHSSNRHRNRKRFLSRSETFGLWPQIQIAAGLNPLRFENRKPNPIFV